jgi:5-methylcytosine-specific restriction protein A
MVVRIGLDTLTSGMGFGSCDSMQLPISVGLLRAMAAEAGIIPAVLGSAPLPIDVGRGRRLASPAQRIAVAERDGGCAWCHAPSSYCDVHHIIHWDDGGPTDLSNLVMLCVSCHHSIHYGRWRIEVKQGEVWFTPPAEYDPTRTPRKSGLAHLNLAA